MELLISDYTFVTNKTYRSVKEEQVKIANSWINHYNLINSVKMRNQRLVFLKNEDLKLRKCNLKKAEYRCIVLRAIKKHSLKENDKRKLKIRLWPRVDERGNKMHDENGITLKVERYDIIAFVRILIAAQELGDDVFKEFLSIYDVKEIIDNISKDYFGDLKLFLNRKTL